MKKLALRFLPWVLITLGAVALSAISRLSFLASLAISAVALFANGLFATLEDDLPGGFNNPDGTQTPSYVRYVAWVVRGIGAIVALVSVIILVAWARS